MVSGVCGDKRRRFDKQGTQVVASAVWRKVMKVIILSGVSGSGKSTYAAKLLEQEYEDLEQEYEDKCLKVSADDFFTDSLSGKYSFDPSRLGEAHASCFRNYIEALTDGVNFILVDNTNTTEAEIAPYVLGANAFGYDVEIHTLVSDRLSAWKRNVHNVSWKGIQAQYERIFARKLPPYWTEKKIPAKGF